MRAVTLTRAERRLFAFLVQVAAERSPETTVRVAGGWVRDKLLGLPGRDIDIVLDDTTGAQFAKHVVAHQRKSKAKGAVSGFGVIRTNPEQSKHLETVAMTIFGEPIDINCFRTDDYTREPSSRIPTTRLGTAEEDAHRRDFTLNALFFNVTESVRRRTSKTDVCVEDFTGRGLDDLRSGLLRTPLAPLETLRDDPLRLLRGIRFASTFGFDLDDGFAEVAALPEIVAALASKVSRERIGIELRKVFASRDPARGFALLEAYGVRDVVFAPHSGAAEAQTVGATTTHWPSDSVAFDGAGPWARAVEHARRLSALRQKGGAKDADADVAEANVEADADQGADSNGVLTPGYALEVMSAALSYAQPAAPATVRALAELERAVAEARSLDVARSGRRFPAAVESLATSYEGIAEGVLLRNLCFSRREPRAVARILALAAALRLALRSDASNGTKPRELLDAWRADLESNSLLAGLWFRAAETASRNVDVGANDGEGLWRCAARVAATSPECWGDSESEGESESDLAQMVDTLFAPAARAAAARAPLLNGHDAVRLLGGGGADVKCALNMVAAWQMTQPHDATKEAAERWLAGEVEDLVGPRTTTK